MRKALSTHLSPPPALRRASPLFRRLPLKGGVIRRVSGYTCPACPELVLSKAKDLAKEAKSKGFVNLTYGAIRDAPSPYPLPWGEGFMQREGTLATLTVLALGAGAAELAAVFLLDGL